MVLQSTFEAKKLADFISSIGIADFRNYVIASIISQHHDRLNYLKRNYKWKKSTMK